MGNIIAHQFIGGKMGKQQNKTVPSGRPAPLYNLFYSHLMYDAERYSIQDIRYAVFDLRRTRCSLKRLPFLRIPMLSGRREGPGVSSKTGLEKLTETSVNVRMRRSQIHQSPKELVGTGSRSTDLEFVTHSNRTRCQFFTALIFYVSFVSRQKRQRTLYETRSPHHLLNSILYFKTNPPFR